MRSRLRPFLSLRLQHTFLECSVSWRGKEGTLSLVKVVQCFSLGDEWKILAMLVYCKLMSASPPLMHGPLQIAKLWKVKSRGGTKWTSFETVVLQKGYCRFQEIHQRFKLRCLTCSLLLRGVHEIRITEGSLLNASCSIAKINGEA